MAAPLEVQLKQTFGKYMELSHKLPADCVKHQGGNLAIDLFEASVDHKAAKAKVRADVMAQGWALRTPKGFRDNPQFKRLPGETDSKAALARFQAAVVALRDRGLGFTAVGWLAAARLLGSVSKKGMSKVRAEKILGKATLTETGTAVASVMMENNTPGIEQLMARFPIGSVAIATLIADMQLYIDAKTRGLSGSTVGGRG
jgi:hypothetical protein